MCLQMWGSLSLSMTAQWSQSSDNDAFMFTFSMCRLVDAQVGDSKSITGGKTIIVFRNEDREE